MFEKKIIIIVLLMVGLAHAQVCMETQVTDALGNNNVLIDCDYEVGPDVCVDLNVDYTPVASTDEYDYESIPFEPEIPFSQGTPLIPTMQSEDGLAVDDKFSDAIPLGFSFCFYDQNFTDVVIGTNGIITFDLDEANADAPSGISVSNPNPALIDNAIFAVQHDMIFYLDDESEIYYSTIGAAPCRKFVINFYNAVNFGCPERSTVQIVLSEFTNEIEVHILSKPIHCPNGRDANSLLGIMNSDGTEGISPPGRNTGEWDAANESWRFFPTGDIPPVIVWTDDLGNEVGRGENIRVCPNRNTVYTAEVQYQSCSGNTLFGTDQINVQFDAHFPAVENESVFICDSGNDGQEQVTLADYNDWILLNNTANFNVAYYTSQSNAESQTGAVNTATLTNDTIYYIRIESIANPGCYTITAIRFTFTAAELGEMEFTICDNNNDGVENNVDLVGPIENMLDGIDYLTYSIHASEQEANAQSNPVTSANVTGNSGFWVYLNISDDCQQIIGPVTVNFLQAPPARTAQVLEFNACDVDFNHREPFEWQTQIPTVINIRAGETFTVHNSLATAQNGTGNQTLIADNINPYYVRIENANGCYTLVELTVDVEFYGVDVVPYTENICFDGTEDITINLNDYPDQMLIDPLEGVDISFYATNADAAAHNLEATINPIQTITEDGYLVVTTYYIRFQISEDCYTVRPVTIRLVNPIPMADPIDVCDIFNDNQENENELSIYNSLILGDQVGTVSYFLNEADAQANTNSINNFNFVNNHVLYVRITSYDCSNVYPINFVLVSVPPSQNIQMDLGEVCDVNQNGITELDLTAFQEQVYSGTENVTFNYYLNYNPNTEELTNPIENPALHPVSGDIIFYIQILEENANCNAIAEVNLNIDFSSTFEINSAELYVCDFEFDLNETFTLNDAFPQITNGISNFAPELYIITYHTNQADANQGNNPIEGETFIPNSAAYPIYVRFENRITGCVAQNILTLYTVGAPKPVNGIQDVCDTNLNGLYDLDLTLLDSIVMEVTDGFIFTYHLTEEDAHNEVNFLDASDYYEADPFPTRIWVRVERDNIEDCYDVNYVDITFTPLTIVEEANFETYGCDYESNGTAVFDLTFVAETFPPDQFVLTYFENLQQVNDRVPEIANPSAYQNTSPHQSTVIVVIEEFGFCPTYAVIDLEYATIDVSVQTEPFCPGTATEIVPDQLNASDNYSYEWLDASGNVISNEQTLTGVTDETTYTLNVTNLDYPNCTESYTLQTTHYEPPVIVDLVEEGSTITIVATGLYPMEYSMDGVNWHGLNYFTDLEPGFQYSFYVRYIQELCVGDPAFGAIFAIPNVITPNGDGYNDEITVKNLHVFNGAESTFEIYDRYGKLIFAETSNTSITWNGMYLGRVLNSTDYWYILRLPDGREVKGSITVKNF